jgi:hypothetical protein
MHFFSKPPFVEPEMTQADYLAEAHAAMKRAEAACKSAKDELFRYECRSKTYGLKTLPDGTTGFQLDQDPERLRLSLVAARRSDEFQAKTRRWSELDRQLHPETIFVAGVRVSP